MKKTTRRLWLLVVTVLVFGIVLALLPSCGFLSEDDEFDPWDEKYFENQDDFYDKHVMVNDALGRTVAVKKDPQCVVTLTASLADMWRLCGGEVFATADDGRDELGLDLHWDAKNLGGVHSPDLEVLLSVSPDLVIASSAIPENVALLEDLENAGITTVFFDVSGFDDYLSVLDVCTDITGRKDLCEKNGLALMDGVDACRARMIETGSAPRVLLLRASSSKLCVKGSEGTVTGEMLYDLGCLNIADIDSSLLDEFSLERIAGLAPDYIFVVIMGDDIDKASMNMSEVLSKDISIWTQLDAVKNGRVHYLDKQRFHFKPNEKWAEAYDYITELLINN